MSALRTDTEKPTEISVISVSPDIESRISVLPVENNSIPNEAQLADFIRLRGIQL